MDALADVLSQADAMELASLPVSIAGEDPVLPTPYRVGTAGAATEAATGLAAADLWRIRTGRTQSVGVNLRAAAVSLRSSKYMLIDGKPLNRVWEPLSGFYRTRDDRRVFLHTNFQNLRDRAVAILNASVDRQSVAAACLNWDGLALETALQEGGACAALVRTEAEWQAHPQAEAVRGIPALEIVKIGDAPPQPLPPGARPLAGVRVLDMTRVIAGPSCARTLAEHGADVLKVSRADLPHSGLLELDTGIGKLAAHLDLRDPAQNETFRGLLRDADVFSQSYRPGTLAARGYAPEDIAVLRPGIVCATLSAWGHVGPWAMRRGYDTVVQAATGMSDVSGGSDNPRHLPVSAIDYVSGALMAFGVMVALARRARIGGSWLVRTSLATTGEWIAGLGKADAAIYESLPAELPESELAPLFAEMPAYVGMLRYLAPVARMSETPTRWVRPPVALGTHAPAWPERSSAA